MAVLRPANHAVINPFDALQREHVLHRRVLSVLERIGRWVVAGQPFPADDVAAVLGYLREFLELAHHRKESRALYPLVMEIADDQVAETVGELLATHEETHELLQSLWLFWEPGELTVDERRVFTELARTYIARTRRHLALEELVLFPVALQIDQVQRARVEAGFTQAAAGLRGIDDWIPVVADLEERWTD